MMTLSQTLRRAVEFHPRVRTVLLGCGATALGPRFRRYSLATILIVLVFGALTGLDGPKVAANESTPWLGVFERISVFGSMLWFVVLALALLRAEVSRRPRQLERPTMTPQRMQEHPR